MASAKIGPATRNHAPTREPDAGDDRHDEQGGEQPVVDRFVEPRQHADAGEAAGSPIAELEQHGDAQHEVRQREHPERDAERRQALRRARSR